MPDLELAELHGSLADPVLGSIGFLNEVMHQYPRAVSFAPGAPYPGFLDDLDVPGHIDLYLDHLRRSRGLDGAAARRLLAEYGPSQGLINDLVAAALRADHGIPVEPDQLVVTVGAQEAMLITLRALCRSRTDQLAVVTPCFAGILGAARLLDIDVVPVPETAGGPDLVGFAAACRAARDRGGRVRALYLAPDFANPSGTLLDLDTRKRLLRLAAREGVLLIEDGTYGFTAAPGAEVPPLKALDPGGQVIHIGTFAKICLPGARVGYVVADQPVREGADAVPLASRLAAIKSMVSVNTSPICQALIGGMLLRHGGSLAALGRTKSALYRANLELLVTNLDRQLAGVVPPAVSWTRPTGGFFVLMRLPVPADAALLAVSAAEYGVLWTPMAQFYPGGGGERELRLSCSYLTPEQIEEGVRRLGRLLANLPNLPSRVPDQEQPPLSDFSSVSG